MRLAGLKYEAYTGKVTDPKTAPKKKVMHPQLLSCIYNACIEKENTVVIFLCCLCMACSVDVIACGIWNWYPSMTRPLGEVSRSIRVST